MKEILKQYSEIAEYVHDYETTGLLSQMSMQVKKNSFILSFMGQFSAGKSKLINNILEMDLLPVHITETTAIVTFIQYAKEPSATIVYKNGIEKRIELDRVKSIWQGNADVNLIDVDYINVQLNHAKLENGLVIADTPGFNTSISEHEEITNMLLQSTEEIVFVMKKPLTEIDLLFLKRVREIGIKISFVRTNMDKINTSEENIDDTIQFETNKLKEEFPGCKTYFVSNEVGNPLYQKIEALRSYIEEELAEDVSEKINESCTCRLQKMNERLMKQIEEKVRALSEIQQGKQSDLIKENEVRSSKLNQFSRLLESNKAKLDKQIKAAGTQAKQDVSEVEELLIHQGEILIKKQEYSDQAEQELKRKLFAQLELAHRKLQEAYLDPYNQILSNNSREIQQELSEVMEESNYLPLDVELPESVVDLMDFKQQEDSRIRELRQQLSELSEKIEERQNTIQNTVMSKEMIEQEQAKLYDEINCVKRELSDIGIYQPQYYEVESQSMQPSEMMRKLGSALDIVSLVVPGPVYGSVAGKIGKQCAKFAQFATKVGQGMSSIDKTKDLLYIVKKARESTKNMRASKKRTEKVLNTVGKVSQIKNMSPTIFDFLSFEYWFEKVGSKFDQPVTLEIDKEYEVAYYQSRDAILRKYEAAKQEEIAMKEQSGLINSKIEREQESVRIDERRAKLIEEELKSTSERLKNEARITAFNKLKKQYLEWYEERVHSLSRNVMDTYRAKIDPLLENYIRLCTEGIFIQINQMNEEINEIMQELNGLDTTEIGNQLRKCNEYLLILGKKNGTI